MIIHLTKRAESWLLSGYVSGEEGLMAACNWYWPAGAGPLGWCRKEDILALVRGYPAARIEIPDGRGHYTFVSRPPKMPTCPVCLVLLDAALEITHQKRTQP